MLIIGDIHGKTEQYFQIISKEKESIQLGDFGFRSQYDWFLKNTGPDHKVLMGNHDYYPYLGTSPKILPSFGYLPASEIFYIRGAYSIDWKSRTIGVDLFENEELTIAEGYQALDLYDKIRPKFVVSHDCPTTFSWTFSNFPPSRTRQLLQSLLDIHQPKLWVFGHHHLSIRTEKFICLKELEFLCI